jgi:hypothetical protein
VPALLIEQPVKAATPAIVPDDVQVDRVPADGLAPMAMVMACVSVVTVLPPASSMVTVGWVANAAPPTAPAGWTVKASCDAVPTVTLKGVLFTAGSVLPDGVLVAVRV